jgi:hypothetical protein
MQSGEGESKVFCCKEANCGRMFDDAELYQRHLKNRHNKTVMADDQSTLAQSMATELNELKLLEASVGSLTHNLKEQTLSDDAIYARSLLEIELEKSKQKKKSSVTFEAVEEAKQQLTDDFVAQKGRECLENEGAQSLELFEVLRLKEVGICFFDKSEYFNPESLRELKLLDLSGNRLLSVVGVTYLYNIETLDVSRNCIGSLEGVEECITLKVLNCNDNFLESCAELKSLKKLKSLDLGNNSLRNLEEVVSTIQELPKLKELVLKGNMVLFCLLDHQVFELQA